MSLWDIKVENKHMATLFFMLFALFFLLGFWQIVTKHYMNIITAIMIFVCLILSMSFLNWQLMRNIEDKLDEYMLRRGL